MPLNQGELLLPISHWWLSEYPWHSTVWQPLRPGWLFRYSNVLSRFTPRKWDKFDITSFPDRGWLNHAPSSRITTDFAMHELSPFNTPPFLISGLQADLHLLLQWCRAGLPLVWVNLSDLFSDTLRFDGKFHSNSCTSRCRIKASKRRDEHRGKWYSAYGANNKKVIMKSKAKRERETVQHTPNSLRLVENILALRRKKEGYFILGSSCVL